MESFLQTDAWARFKATAGWSVRRVNGFLSLNRVVGAGRSIQYLPELPFTQAAISTVAEVKQMPHPRQIFSRFEFLEPWSDEKAKTLLGQGLIKSFEEVQPEYRQWIDLTQSEAKLLAQMKPKGRYNIKVAGRHQLKVRRSTNEKDVEIFFRLYQHTAERTHFSGRGLSYFQQLVKTLADTKAGEIVIVESSHQPLAAAIVSYYQGLASYLYGGSGGDRSLMAPYLLHFSIMKRAKERHCQIYDLLAVAPTEADSSHPYAGLSRFKTQFGGQTVRLLGSWDLVENRFWYTIYRFAERLRRRKTTH